MTTPAERPGFDVGDCRIVGLIHRYLVECYRCPDWFVLPTRRTDAIKVAEMHNEGGHSE